MIPLETIEQVREATDIAQIISLYLKLKKRGRNFLALCPFHTEKTPSFNVSPDKQIFHCFGCGKGGNVYTFLMDHEKMSFVEAVKFLAARASITIKEDKSDYRREVIERLNYAHTTAVEYFQSVLNDSRYKVVLKDYLQDKRSISEQSIKFFGLGLSSESWDGLLTYAAKKDIKPEEMTQAGLAILSERKKKYFDRFRQRLMIPIFNLSGKPIAFGGRTMKKGEPAKYINSPETSLYSKSNVLYGLNFSRDHIRDANEVYVVEGYFDVISLWQAGVQNVVASSGTAFTPQQARLLARFAEKAYLFFDADSAGRKAALRSVDSLFDAGLEVMVMQAPPGEDPDTVARKFGQDKIDELKHDALDYITFRVQQIDPSETGLIGREKLIKELAALANRINDPTRRSLFQQEAAKKLGIDDALMKSAALGKQQYRETPVREKGQFDKHEFEFLSLMLHNPGVLDKAFASITPADFDSRKLARIYSAMQTQYEHESATATHHLIEMLRDEQLSSVIAELASQEWPPDEIDAEAAKAINDFVERLQKQERTTLMAQLVDSQQQNDHKRADRIIEKMKALGLYDVK